MRLCVLTSKHIRRLLTAHKAAIALAPSGPMPYKLKSRAILNCVALPYPTRKGAASCASTTHLNHNSSTNPSSLLNRLSQHALCLTIQIVVS